MKETIAPKVVDDFLSIDDAGQVSEVLHDQRFPWYYLENLSGEVGGDAQPQYGFYHLLFYVPDGGVTSDLFEPLAPLWRVAQSFAPEQSMYRARARMSTNTGSAGVGHAHVDYFDPHTVVLFYASDSDGDTLFYGQDGEVVDRVQPRFNRAVVFDGLTMHASSYPTSTNRRTVVNMNFFPERE